jgi:predicted RND superfamily exporter protein
LTLFFGYFVVTDLRVDNRYGILLPKDHPVQKNYVTFKKQFGEDGATLVMAISSKDLYSEKKFKAWKELGDKILAQPGVETVISEATLFNIVNDTAEQKFVIHRIFYDTTFKEKSIDSIRAIIKKNPAYKNVLYNDSSEVSLMLIGLNEKVLEDKVKSKVVFHIEELTKHYEPTLGKFYFSGLPHIRVTVAKRILNEMFLFLGLSALASSLLLYIFFRSFRIVIQCNLVVFVSVIWALGTIALFNYSLTIILIIFGYLFPILLFKIFKINFTLILFFFLIYYFYLINFKQKKKLYLS